MNVTIPDHYVANVGGALVERAVQVINRLGFVPAYLHQFADLWDSGLRYSSDTFWKAVYDSGAKHAALKKAGLI